MSCIVCPNRTPCPIWDKMRHGVASCNHYKMANTHRNGPSVIPSRCLRLRALWTILRVLGGQRRQVVAVGTLDNGVVGTVGLQDVRPARNDRVVPHVLELLGRPPRSTRRE